MYLLREPNPPNVTARGSGSWSSSAVPLPQGKIEGAFMVTASWVFYDIVVFVVGFYFMDRRLTTREKGVVTFLVLIGIAVAVYGGYSDYRDSKAASSLANQVEYLKRQQADNQNAENAHFAALRMALHLPPDESGTNVLAAAVKVLNLTALMTTTGNVGATAKVVAPKPHPTPPSVKTR
jgi:hypothetical protein